MKLDRMKKKKYKTKKLKGRGFGKVEAYEELDDISFAKGDIKNKNKKFMDDIKDARDYAKTLKDSGATRDEISDLLTKKGFKDGHKVLKHIGAGKKKKKSKKNKRKTFKKK